MRIPCLQDGDQTNGPADEGHLAVNTPGCCVQDALARVRLPRCLLYSLQLLRAFAFCVRTCRKCTERLYLSFRKQLVITVDTFSATWRWSRDDLVLRWKLQWFGSKSAKWPCLKRASPNSGAIRSYCPNPELLGSESRFPRSPDRNTPPKSHWYRPNRSISSPDPELQKHDRDFKSGSGSKTVRIVVLNSRSGTSGVHVCPSWRVLPTMWAC